MFKYSILTVFQFQFLFQRPFCNDGHRPDYDYILVDEFQDISLDRYRFLQSLRRARPLTKLFCVGDDWQSIYRFAGSDISLFKQFSKYFGYCKECRMETTYRFGNPCVERSSRFILTNREQKEKTVRPFSPDVRTDLQFFATSGSGGMAIKVNGKIRAILTVIFVRRVIFVPFLIAERNSALPEVVTQTAFFVALAEHRSSVHILVI